MKRLTEEQAILYTLEVYNLLIHFKLGDKRDLFNIRPDLSKGFKYLCSLCEYSAQERVSSGKAKVTKCRFCPLVIRSRTTCDLLLSYEIVFNKSLEALEDLYKEGDSYG